MYCESDSNSSWANINDLYDRYGEEFIDKLSIRRNFNEVIQEYVADESIENKTRVQSLALCDARDMILSMLSPNFSNLKELDIKKFHAVKLWHIKFTIELLKQGGDCATCKAEFEDFIKSNKICSDTICLSKKTTFISATKAVFDCEIKSGCGCD